MRPRLKTLRWLTLIAATTSVAALVSAQDSTIVIRSTYVSQPIMASLPADPQQVVLSAMHATNQLEMKLGKFASEHSTSDPIRRLGDRLWRDHRLADQMVTDLAKADQIELLMPTQLPSADKFESAMEKGRQLQALGGEQFDRMYLMMMVGGHRNAIAMLEQALTALPEGGTRTLVERLLPILRQHLQLSLHLQAGTGTPATAMTQEGEK